MSVEHIVGPSDRKPASEKEALRGSVDELIHAVRTLVSVFEKARDEIRAEPTQQVLMKLDELTIYNKQLVEQNREIMEQAGKVLAQNKEIAHSLLMLLDLHREHLPDISRNTRLTSEIRRVPQTPGFSGPAPSRTRHNSGQNGRHEGPGIAHP